MKAVVEKNTIVQNLSRQIKLGNALTTSITSNNLRFEEINDRLTATEAKNHSNAVEEKHRASPNLLPISSEQLKITAKTNYRLDPANVCGLRGSSSSAGAE